MHFAYTQFGQGGVIGSISYEIFYTLRQIIDCHRLIVAGELIVGVEFEAEGITLFNYQFLFFRQIIWRRQLMTFLKYSRHFS